MLRFLTPADEWAQRIGNPVSLPTKWPFMPTEIFIAEDDVIWMTSAVGVTRSCMKAFLAQGIYLYQFGELPEAIIQVLDQHFVQVGRSQAQVGFASPNIQAEAHSSEEVNRG